MNKTIKIYDPPMCCSSGVCGTSVNSDLVRFAGDLEFLKTQGIEVQRFNMSSDPAAFVASVQVKQTLADEGNDCLPLVLIAGAIVSKGRYPARSELQKWAGLDVDAQTSCVQPAAAKCRPGCCCRQQNE